VRKLEHPLAHRFTGRLCRLQQAAQISVGPAGRDPGSPIAIGEAGEKEPFGILAGQIVKGSGHPTPGA